MVKRPYMSGCRWWYGETNTCVRPSGVEGRSRLYVYSFVLQYGDDDRTPVGWCGGRLHNRGSIER